MLIPVDRADDPRLLDYFNLREPEAVKRRGVFLAEGVEVVRTLLSRSPFRVRSLLLTENRLPALGVDPESVAAPVYVGTEALVSQVVGFPLHRGCLAAGESVPWDWRALLAQLGPGPRTVLALEALANHDNVGSIFRSAAAFGVDAILLDPRTADPLYRKAIRTSMGAALWLPFARVEPWPAALTELVQNGWQVAALTPREDSLGLQRWSRDAGERVILALGTEGSGLEPDTLRSCEPVRISMAPGVDSLNVAVSAAIALNSVFEARYEKRTSSLLRNQPAPAHAAILAPGSTSRSET